MPIVAAPIGRNPIQLRVPGCLEWIVATVPDLLPSGDDAAQRDRNKPPRWSNLRATGCVSRAHRAVHSGGAMTARARHASCVRSDQTRSDGRRRVSHSAPDARVRATGVLIAMPEKSPIRHHQTDNRVYRTPDRLPHETEPRRLGVSRSARHTDASRECAGLPGAGERDRPYRSRPIGPQRFGGVLRRPRPRSRRITRRAAHTPGYRPATGLQGQRSSGGIASGPAPRSGGPRSTAVTRQPGATHPGRARATGAAR